MNNQTRIYKPLSASEKGLFGFRLTLIKDVINARELIWRLFLRDFKARYKQSLLGWGWIFLLPLLAIGTFLILNQAGAIKIGGGIPVPYIIFGLIGISFWQIFASGLSAATGSIVTAGSFVAKIHFPREALVISAIGQTVVEFFVRMVLLLFIYIIYGLTPSPWIILSPILAIPLILLTLGLGFVTSLLNTIARDIQIFINVVMSFLIFLMPIMYNVSEDSLLFSINKFNPIFFLVSVPRDIIISGSFTHLHEFFVSSIISIIIFFFGWIIFTKAQTKITEVV